VKRSTFIKIGFIVSLSIFGLLWGLNFLKGKGAFSNDEEFYVVYERIDGLEVTNPVLINGFKVGQVRDIHFLPGFSGKLVVVIALKPGLTLPKGTIARIYSSDLMGTKAVELILGKLEQAQLVGDTLIPDFEGSLQELVSIQMLPLKNKAESLMKEMEDAIEIVKVIFNEDTRNDITSSFKNIKATFANLEKSSTNIDSIVSSGKTRIDNILIYTESITKNLEAHNKDLANAMKNISKMSDSLAQANLKQVVMSTYSVMNQLDEITHKINGREGTLGLLLNNDTLYQNLEDVSYNLNRLVEDLRLNPKRYVQFSAFNLGKTVYVDQDQSDTRGKKEKIVYKIQIKNSNTPIALIPENFKGYKNVEEAMVGGSYIYLLGNKKNLESARYFLKEVKVNFPEAFVVEIMEGRYTPIN
jgi:phospholipid/cholesterol/gamma-HCH transport system substrate-binding protein